MRRWIALLLCGMVCLCSSTAQNTWVSALEGESVTMVQTTETTPVSSAPEEAGGTAAAVAADLAAMAGASAASVVASAVPVTTTETAENKSSATSWTQFEKTIAAGLKKRWQGKQAIVVRADGANSATAKLWLYEYKSGAWRVKYGPWTVVVGRNGVGKAAEGDGRSPSGAFLLGTAFGWGSTPSGVDYQYRKVDSKDLWVDEAGPWYNRWVRGSTSVYGSGERLKNVKGYEYAIAVHFNDKATKNAGSAIFLHIWSGKDKGTAGCTAMSRTNLLRLLKWLDYDKRPILLQGTEAQLKKLMGADWGIDPLPAGWGYVDDFIPDAAPDLRYATKNNFTGAKLPGYKAPLAPMRMEAIKGLAKVAKALRKDGYGIRVYDAYRPQAATDAMLKWAKDEDDTATKAEYYPGIDKADIPGRYVATRSKHRLGGTVDLTLLKWSTGKNLDMGGSFDFFGAKSHYSYKGLTTAQRSNRARLRKALSAQGFEPYSKEWWHFTDAVPGSGGTFSIRPRQYVLH